MNKREEVAKLKKSLLFGNVGSIYIASLNKSREYTIVFVLSKLFERWDVPPSTLAVSESGL